MTTHKEVLTKLLKLIPLKMRLENIDDFKQLIVHYDLPMDLLRDQRSVRADLSGTTHWAHKRAHVKDYLVDWRSYGGAESMSLYDAAKFVRLSPNSLRQRISSNKVYSKSMIEPDSGLEDIVMITKLPKDQVEKEPPSDRPFESLGDQPLTKRLF